jgi:hypothetical protein
MTAGKLASFALAASLSFAPLAVAQAATTATNSSTSNAATAETANWQNNPLLTQNGAVRAGKLIGTDVYNNQNQKLGSVDGVLINRSGEAQVVLSYNNKLVEVPWNSLQFGNPNSNGGHKVVLPNMTKNELGSMQAFHYTPNNKG